MPWKECKPMDERIRFIARLLEGEKMAPLCREFGISRVTGYKIFKRYKDCGLDALYNRSRAPYRQANKLPYQAERMILGIKKAHPSWGAPKIRDKLIRQFPMIKPPAISTIRAMLDRHGLVKRKKRRRHKAKGTPLVAAHEPNGLWCADYKGEVMLGNKQYCYPLTITDYSSRHLITCEGLKSTKSDFAFTIFEAHSRTSGYRRPSAPSAKPALGVQRRAVCLGQCAVRSFQALGLVVALGHQPAAHQARAPGAKRPSRTHAPDAEDGSH